MMCDELGGHEERNDSYQRMEGVDLRVIQNYIRSHPVDEFRLDNRGMFNVYTVIWNLVNQHTLNISQTGSLTTVSLIKKRKFWLDKVVETVEFRGWLYRGVYDIVDDIIMEQIRKNAQETMNVTLANAKNSVDAITEYLK